MLTAGYQCIRKHWIVLLLTALFVAVVVTAYNGDGGKKDFFAFALTLCATFLGAFFAFFLNERKESEKLHSARRAALHGALFVLGRQINAILLLKQDFDQYESPIQRAFCLPAFQPPPYADITHNVASLYFLFENADINLLLDLSIEQDRFHQALESLRKRNVCLVQEVQLALGKHGLNGKEMLSEQIKAVLGEELFNKAISYAEETHQHILECSKSIPAIHDEIHKTAKKLYPHHKFAKPV